MRKLINIEICILIILIGTIFFIKNPLLNWLEGDFENIYFIYNTILTANSITPEVVDYPGNSSFSLNSIYLKILSLIDHSITLNLESILKDDQPVLNFNKIYFYLKIIQLFYFFIGIICLYKILIYLGLEKKIAFLVSLLFLFSDPLIDNIQRYRFDIESIVFYLISTLFLVYSKTFKNKIICIFFSGFFLCMSLFSKIIILPFFLIIPIWSCYKKQNSFRLIIKDFFTSKELIPIFLSISIVMIILSFQYGFKPIYFITNYIIYLTFFYFYFHFFKEINKQNLYKNMFFFVSGILSGILLMFSQSLNFQKILFVTNPYFFIQHHSLNHTHFSYDIVLSVLQNIQFNYIELFFIFFSLCFIIIKKNYNSYLNFFLLIIYFLYKIIVSSKDIYLDIFPLLILLILFVVNYYNKYNFLIYISFFVFFTLNINNIFDNSFNKVIDNVGVCDLKVYDVDTYKTLNKHEHFLLYYTPRFSEYNFMKKLC